MKNERIEGKNQLERSGRLELDKIFRMVIATTLAQIIQCCSIPNSWLCR